MSKRWFAVRTLLFMLCILLLAVQLHSLQRDYNIALASFSGAVGYSDVAEICGGMGDGVESAVFTRSENVPVQNEYRAAAVTAYCCTESYFELCGLERLSGRLIWDDDSAAMRRCAVLDERLAVLFFAGKDCIGEELVIGGEKYSVAGVCSSDESILTSVDKYSVYLPLGSGKGGRTGCVFRSENSTALSIELSRTNMFGKNGTGNVDRIDYRAGMWAAAARGVLLALCLCALARGARLAGKHIRRRAAEIGGELGNAYLSEYLKRHIRLLLLHIAIAAAIAAAAALLFRAIAAPVSIDPALLPSSLIDLRGWAENIAEYARARNAADTIPFPPSVSVTLRGAAAVLLAAAAWVLESRIAYGAANIN